MKPFYQDDFVTLFNAPCEDVLPTLPANSIDAIVTSPPYAEQRAKFYGGVSEREYPAWTVAWMNAARPALTPTASVLINIREHVRDGEISDYVLLSRLGLRQAGWTECDELIWIKPRVLPVGHPKRPRRSWERILWFGNTREAWCDPLANGRQSERGGMEGKGIAWVSSTSEKAVGRARCQDYVSISVDNECNPANFGHPAAYPPLLAAWMVKLVVPAGGTVLDPFGGSATTARAAKDLGIRSVVIEQNEAYCEAAARRLSQSVMDFEGAPV
jgi:site-specific DNA-methyltransferase (adenine-specific)